MAFNIYPALSITATTTPQKLLTLLLAADPTIAPRGREITFQNHPTNTSNILIGAGNVSVTNCGYMLQPGVSRTYRSGEEEDASALPNIYIASDTGTAQMNIEIILK